MLVKAIKQATGLGLKDSKDIVDYSSESPIMFRKRMSLEDLKSFRELLDQTDAEFTLDDISQIRRRKLVDLGLCDKTDLIEEIVNQNIHSIFKEGVSITHLSKLLTDIYSNIDETKLRKIYESNSEKTNSKIS